LAALRAARDTGEDAETVRADHAALYGTLAVARVAPYESVHRGEEGLVFAEHTLQVRDAYRTLSLEAPRLNREPDDHIGLELEFVARSCLRALGALDQGSPRDAERYVRLGADFLRDHLLRWAPAMLDRVTQEARTRFMPGLARLTTGAIEEYARFTGVPTEAGPRRPSRRAERERPGPAGDVAGRPPSHGRGPTCPGPETENGTAPVPGAVPSVMRVGSGAHALHDELAHPGGVGLPAGGLHDRTDDGAGCLDLAAADLVGDVRVGGQGLVDGGEQRAVVGDDLHAAGNDDLLRAALSREHAFEHLPGELVVDPPGVHERLQLGDLGRGDGQLLELDPLGPGGAGELAHPPLAGGGGVGTGGDGGLDEVDRPGVDDVAHLRVAVAPLLLEPAPADAGQLGQGLADLLDPLPARCQRHEVGLGEVAVVLGVGLHPTG